MAFSERLVVYIDAVTGGAVRGFQQTAVAAQGLDAKTAAATSRSQKFANMLPIVGTAALAVGAALYKSVDAYTDSERATLKLQNSLKRNPLLAGESAKAFLDQASAIQRSTVASDESVVGAQAMLATFRLTKGEIMGLTPLVVDYARKFDTDLVSASKQVGKAMDGQIGALKRNGVTIDQTMFATDRYRAVTEALRGQVGGFANEEANTAAGKIAQLGNRLNDLMEIIGGGIAPAIEGFVGGLMDVVDGVDDVLGPIGGLATAVETYYKALISPALLAKDAIEGIFGSDTTIKADSLKEALTKAPEWARGYITSAYESKIAVDGMTAAEREAARAIEDVRSKIEAKTNAVWAGIDADMAAKGATLAVQEAAQRYNETLADPASSPLERARAEYQYEQSLIAAAKANGDAAAAALGNASAGEKAQANTQAQIDTLKFLAGTLEPGSPLRANIEAYIGQLMAVPGARHTRITAEVDPWSIATAEELLNAVARNRRVDLIGNAVGPPGKQFGGSVLAGQPYVVGERRPELFVPNESGRIYPNLNGLGGGGGDAVTTVTVNVMAAANVDKAAVGSDIADALDAYFSRRGARAGWRNN